MKNALQIANTALDEIGMPRVNSVVDLNDDTGRQLLALLNRELCLLADRDSGVNGWPQLRKEWALAVTAGVDNYPLPADMAYLIPNTGWDRGRLLAIEGSLNPSEWQTSKTFLLSSGFYPMFRIMEGRMFFQPAPPGGSTYYFEYYSNSYVLDGTTPRRELAKDTDEPVLPDSIMIMGLKWRWLRAKGLDYVEERDMHEAAIQRALARSSRPQDAYLDNGYFSARAYVD